MRKNLVFPSVIFISFCHPSFCLLVLYNETSTYSPSQAHPSQISSLRSLSDCTIAATVEPRSSSDSSGEPWAQIDLGNDVWLRVTCLSDSSVKSSLCKNRRRCFFRFQPLLRGLYPAK